MIESEITNLCNYQVCMLINPTNFQATTDEKKPILEVNRQ